MWPVSRRIVQVVVSRKRLIIDFPIPSQWPRLSIGLISGTSVDAINAVLVRIISTEPDLRVEYLGMHQTPFSPDVRGQIFDAFSPEKARVELICELNFRLGELFAEAALALCREFNLEPSTVDFIASHGQTVYHLPPRPDQGRPFGSTLQLGEPAVIAERTGILTVADFRPADMAAGGQGAPLVSYADYALFVHPLIGRAVQNIGGIANVTYLPPMAKKEDVISFDTGPGNMIIDGIVRLVSHGKEDYDEDGHRAAAGHVDNVLLAELLQHPYYSQRPPKTSGREEFGDQYVQEIWEHAYAQGVPGNDLIATVTALTAETISRSYREYLPISPEQTVEVIVGGGGARNHTLMTMLRERLPEYQFRHHEAFGFPDEAKEALAFCIMGDLCLQRRSNNVPSATGATHEAILGKVVFPPPHLT